MIITPKHYAVALYETLAEAPQSRRDAIINNLVLLLAKNHDLNKIKDIENEFLKYDKSKNAVFIETARPLKTQLKKEIMAMLGKKTDNLEIKINNKIIGGFRLTFNDILIDNTFQGKIKKLTKKITDF